MKRRNNKATKIIAIIMALVIIISCAPFTSIRSEAAEKEIVISPEDIDIGGGEVYKQDCITIADGKWTYVRNNDLDVDESTLTFETSVGVIKKIEIKDCDINIAYGYGKDFKEEGTSFVWKGSAGKVVLDATRVWIADYSKIVITIDVPKAK